MFPHTPHVETVALLETVRRYRVRLRSVNLGHGGRRCRTTALRLRPGTNRPATSEGSDANLHVQVTGATKRFHLWQQAAGLDPRLRRDRARLPDGAARLRLRGGLVRRLDGDRALGDRVVPVAVLDRRDVGQHGAGTRPRKKAAPTPDESADRAHSRARAGRRSRRGSRTRGTAAPAARRRRSPSRGSIVSAYMTVIATHVQTTRRSQRALPRGRARRRGRPAGRDTRRRRPGRGTRSRRRCTPRSGAAVIVFVGPRYTEMMSTSGITNATSTTHDSCSKSARNAQPANTAAQSFAKFAASPQSASVQTSATSASTTTAGKSQRRVPERQRDQHEQQRRRHAPRSRRAGSPARGRARARCGATMNHASDDRGDGDERRDAPRASSTEAAMPTTRRAA